MNKKWNVFSVMRVESTYQKLGNNPTKNLKSSLQELVI